MRKLIIMTLVLILLPVSLRADGKKKAKIDRSTPEKTIAGFMSAMAGRRWAASFHYLTETLQLEILDGSIFVFNEYRLEKPEMKKILDAVRKKYNLAWDAKKQTLKKGALKNVSNKPALFRDLAQIRERMMKGKFNSREFTEPEFSQFRVRGDNATAVMSIKGQKVMIFKFRRRKNEWVIAGRQVIKKGRTASDSPKKARKQP